MKKRVLFGCVCLLLGGGCVKDRLYRTIHPDKGAVRVRTDWSGRSAEAVLPGNYVLRGGEVTETVSGERNVMKALFLPGRYELLVYNGPAGVTVEGEIGMINTLGDGTLEPLPGYLFSGAVRMDVVADDTLDVDVALTQRTHRLRLSLGLAPGDEKRVERVSAVLTGMAGAVDLTSGVAAGRGGKSVIPDFELVIPGNGRAGRSGEARLEAVLGVLGAMPGERQELSLTLTMVGGHVVRVDSDLTGKLEDVGSGGLEPLELDAVLELPSGAGVTATIGDWVVVDNGRVEM